MSISIDDLRTHLTTFIAGNVNAPTHIKALHPISGGASRETWALDIEVESGSQVGHHALIFRMDQASSMNPEALERSEEFALLQVAYAAGVKAPQPRWLDAVGAALGRPFLLMDRVEGESIGPRVVRRPEFAQAREHLPQQMAEQLARIHAIDPTIPKLGFLPRPPEEYSPARHAIDGVRQQLDQLGIQRPALEFGLRWLAQHVPRHEEHVLIHGDFRIGNLIVGPEELRAVIDWEFAHVGDPHEDLAWPCVRDWRFGNDTLRVGGVGDVETYVTAYEALSGRTIDRTALHYWEVMGNVRWAATCYVQADRHLSGADPSIELVSLGRRAAEMELEFLTLIGG
ncbi:MAG: phosphotransferase family protein [Chloroflexi bacterium AL-W]|nr:phosphotransferase family protein [Chloroflexi bacterium AL-N1]NOK70531.1 phosphotransferase family protein [Chloroflexi bacterium AL-N10]NOK78110.1 phosphotransferase family protein [Chloroflexi bacterium AL-N5]NOK85209.1 phosphotransferase family protein [Chloroflexi bacterium AL-W]NOK91974.1 phosphotransferase family protein [Chloroflexi bacterium AL-N15]